MTTVKTVFNKVKEMVNNHYLIHKVLPDEGNLEEFVEQAAGACSALITADNTYDHNELRGMVMDRYLKNEGQKKANNKSNFKSRVSSPSEAILGSNSEIAESDDTNTSGIEATDLAEKFNPKGAGRFEKIFTDPEIEINQDSGNMIKGWEIRKEFETYIGLPNCLETLTTQARLFILFILKCSQFLNQEKRNEARRLIGGSVLRMQINSKPIGVLSNVGMRDASNASPTKGELTLKAGFAVAAKALEEFILVTPIPVLEVQGLSWIKSEAVRQVFGRPLNLLLTLDGVQSGFNWEEGEFSVEKQSNNDIDPSYAYGVTFISIYSALKVKLGSDTAEEVAHKSASKKIGRLVQAGYKVEFEKAFNAACLVVKQTAVPREIAARLKSVFDAGQVKTRHAEITSISSQVAEIFAHKRAIINDPNYENKMTTYLGKFNEEVKRTFREIEVKQVRLSKYKPAV